jgi:plastocyanin
MELWQMGEPRPTVTTFAKKVVDFVGREVRRVVEPGRRPPRKSRRRRRTTGADMPDGFKARAGVGAVVALLSSFAFVVAGAPARAATTHHVSVVDFAFSPKTLTVEPGDTVTWTNNSGLPHTVTADDGSFDSGSLGPGQTFTHTFGVAATVPYHCSFHGAPGGQGMAGTVVVRSASPATTAPRVTTPATAPSTPTTAPAGTTSPAAAAPSTSPPPASAAGGPVTPAPVADATTSASQPELAHTGSNSAALDLLAAAILVTGVLAVTAGRRRSRLDRRA